jgi:hypothetical protein
LLYSDGIRFRLCFGICFSCRDGLGILSLDFSSLLGFGPELLFEPGPCFRLLSGIFLRFEPGGSFGLDFCFDSRFFFSQVIEFLL